MHDPLVRLYRTKLALLATLLIVAGLALLFLSHSLARIASLRWLRDWPITDIGSGLFTTGLLGVALQYFDGQDSEVRATQRLQRVLAAATPAMRDAVISGFAFEPEDLARVATPQTLDRIVTNGLAIRLRDAAFASDVFQDIQARAIDVPERLRDARISIRMSQLPTSGSRRSQLVATVRWEYSLRPKHQTRRFVCVSDLEEFRQLDRNGGATSAWYIKARPGVDASARATFDLVDFTVDGSARPIRRSERKHAQVFAVDLGPDLVANGKEVSLAYTYRTIANDEDDILQLRVDQPTHGLDVSFVFTDTDVASVRVLDYIASAEPARVSHTSASVPERGVNVEFDGWALANSGLAFVWSRRGRS